MNYYWIGPKVKHTLNVAMLCCRKITSISKTQQLITHNQLAALPLLGNAEIHPVADHDGVLVAEVVGDALGADGALGLDVRVI